MILTKENQCIQEKTCPSATLFTKNLTWAGLELHLGLCTEKPVNNCLSPNMAVSWLVKFVTQ
jgi:hypothetical protein